MTGPAVVEITMREMVRAQRRLHHLTVALRKAEGWSKRYELLPELGRVRRAIREAAAALKKRRGR